MRLGEKVLESLSREKIVVSEALFSDVSDGQLSEKSEIGRMARCASIKNLMPARRARDQVAPLGSSALGSFSRHTPPGDNYAFLRRSP
jgi:hypothetical protein